MEGVSAEMPRYRSHKEVWALQIADGIEVLPDGSVKLPIADVGYAPVIVSKDVVHRYMPQPGDFYVVYRDGYKSISPGSEFRDGYTRIS